MALDGSGADECQELGDRITHFLQHAYALKQLHVHEAIQNSQLFKGGACGGRM